ncbi:MAG: hypothetical protein QM751_01340 [Paludibacteraceae bacterium]
MTNTHNTSIPKEVLDQINQKIAEIIELAKPHIVSLTPAERTELAKLGDKTLTFVEKTKTHLTANPQLKPAYFNTDEFIIDYNDYQNLRPVVNIVTQLLHNIEDAMMVAGSEAYISSLSFYNSVKDAAKRDIPGAKAVYEDLKARFPNNRSKSKKA